MAAKNNSNKGSYRDKLSTVDESGKRSWVFAKKPKGKLYNKRQIVAYILLAAFYILPWVKYKGEQFLMFNILERKFVIFGTVFWPQDFHLIVLSFITMILFIILFTIIFGRLFCGWVCPQTLFMEFIFRRIEYLIEGNASEQRKLAKQNWNFEKIWKKSIKHLIFYAVAFISGSTLLAYVIGSDQLVAMAEDGVAKHVSGFIGLLLFSGVFYFIFAFFREQVCTIACPYGRLQGVLIDPKTIIVAYDYKRGEPRGPIKNPESGDCVNCQACVQVCPTGIDIRNGTQLECINCTACIDACNATMKKVNKPLGLIRYDSEEGIEKGEHHLFNARTIFYSVVLTALLMFVAFLFYQRGDSETVILRARGTLYQEVGDSLTNIYNYQVVNKSRGPINVLYKLENIPGRIQSIGGDIIVKKGEVKKGTILVFVPKSALKQSKTPIIIGIYHNGKRKEGYKTMFVAPNNLDNK